MMRRHRDPREDALLRGARGPKTALIHNTPKLSDWPLPMVRLACDTCERRGQFRKETLIERFGPDALMPDVRQLVVECPRHRTPGLSCGVYFADQERGAG